ncbi:hypothetical protein EGW08_018930 [Elysia chlorotica]|uniref:Transferrin-like domain-containing protein n=1 Tax=Elysia chlorotica TaxID=188477 RepID=A0A433SVH1_ELYCH|nr:hypothetical protein EGW08_018930 [Elysia chlorotica]
MRTLLQLCIVISFAQFCTADRPTRWCVTNEEEAIKCKFLKDSMTEAVANDPDLAKEFPEDFQCIRKFDQFSCMEGIELDNIDLITLDSGQAYFAGRQHNMMPIMAESYEESSAKLIPTYYSVAVFKSSNPVSLQNLRSAKVCFSGIGMSAGWVHPIGRLLNDGIVTARQCNAIVKAVASSFESMCLPGALTSFYNPFGNNPTTVCKLCGSTDGQKCTTSDIYAGYDGAFRCLAEGGGDLTFVRHDTIDSMTRSGNSTGSSGQYSRDAFQLLCPDKMGRTASVDDYANCNWGEISSNVIMTSAVRDPDVVEGYKKFLKTLERLFGPSGSLNLQFNIFGSFDQDPANGNDIVRKHLMFSDTTKKFVDIANNNYFTWVSDDFNRFLSYMSQCPSNVVRWCVISLAEKLKCEDMIMAFKAKELRPEMDCLYGGNTSNCMEMIWRGDADLMNLDAGDIYIAGRRYGLIPIAAEDYGDMTMQFKVVAAAHKTNKETTLFNMKGKRSCQPGIGRGDGWIIPLNIYIETEQFLPDDCTIFRNIGELFTRSCIPGALDSEYNPGGEPINLCEGCAAGGFRKCQRNSDEQYYGATGAFRCLVENGGDVAFVRHLTVRDNTDGRNHAIWARNRRSDDYELLCKDGRRLNIDRFEECHLGYVPSNAVVTSAGQDPRRKEIMWNLLNYGQQFFSSDIDGDFHMFDSGIWYTDLLFSDDAVRLMPIAEDQQNYQAWLGESFIAQIENLHRYTCVNPDAAISPGPSVLLTILLASLSFYQLQL